MLHTLRVKDIVRHFIESFDNSICEICTDMEGRKIQLNELNMH